MALGICDAFRDAELLAAALDEGFSGRAPLAEALSGFQRRRDELTLPDYRRNLHAARFEPLPAEVAQARAAVRGNQEATNKFLMVLQGMIPPETVTAPSTLPPTAAQPIRDLFPLSSRRSATMRPRFDRRYS
jgi:hypothetical protein